MLFVAFALVITVGIALAINADIGTFIGLSQNQTARAIPLVVILMLVASALVHRRHRLGEIVSGFAIWIAIGAVLVGGYAYRYELSQIGQRMMGALQPGAAIVDAETGNVHVSRSFGGSFRIDSNVNGTNIPMIFDTGATAVVLSQTDARRVGLNTGALDYSIPVQTANGTGAAASVVIDEIRVGNIARRGIRGYVVQDGALETSLLGMTFLETLSRYTVSQDSLEMHD